MSSNIKFSVTKRISSAPGRKSVAPFSLPISGNTMINKLKFGMLALVAMICMAIPAFAQGLETGTAANTYGWNSPQAKAISVRSSGLHAFARVPRARAHVRSGRRAFDMVPGAAFGSDSPSATGGGSVGYNSYDGRDS